MQKHIKFHLTTLAMVFLAWSIQNTAIAETNSPATQDVVSEANKSKSAQSAEEIWSETNYKVNKLAFAKKYAQAEPLAIQNLAFAKQHFAARHKRIVYSLTTLAFIYGMDKKLIQAETLFLEARQHLSTDKQTALEQTMTIQSSLGTNYSMQNSLKKAEDAYLTALEAAKQLKNEQREIEIATLLALLYDTYRLNQPEKKEAIKKQYGLE